MSRQRSFGSLDGFLSLQDDRQQEERPNYFIPGINGRARCLTGVKRGETRTIYSCPSILQSKGRKPNASLAAALSADGNQTKSTQDTDTCTLSTKGTNVSAVDTIKVLTALHDRSQARNDRILEVQKDIIQFHNTYKLKRERWRRIAYLDQLVDSTPLPTVNEQYMSAFDAEVCGSVVSSLTNDQSIKTIKKQRNKKHKKAKKRVIKIHQTIHEGKETESNDHFKSKVDDTPSLVTSDVTASESQTTWISSQPTNGSASKDYSADDEETALSPCSVDGVRTKWISEQPRILSSSTDYTADEADSVVSLCSMDGGKTNLRLRRTQRLAAASTDDIRHLFLMVLADKTSE